MKKLIKIESTKSETYIYWLLTDFCNQKCSYCSSYFNSGNVAASNRFPNSSKILQFLDTLSNLALTNKDRKFFICLSGGEPTTHDLFPEIIQRLKDFAYVHVITNGTRNVSYWKSFVKLPDYVIISLHPEYYDKKKIRINELSEFLSNSGVHVRYNLMCHPSHWETVLNIYNDIDDKFKPFIVNKVIHDYNQPGNPQVDYSQEQLDFIRFRQTEDPGLNRGLLLSHYDDGTITPVMNANKIMAEGQNFFKGWKCSAGSEIVSINYDGTVYAGLCKIKYLGTLENFSILNEYVTCNRNACVTPADIHCSKYKN